MGVAITNAAAADTLARSMVWSLPGSGSTASPRACRHRRLGRPGEQGEAVYLADMSVHNPDRRIGTTHDTANGILFAMASTFLNGQTLHIDGGEPLIGPHPGGDPAGSGRFD